MRGRIAELAECLAQAEERLSRLVVAPEVVGEVLDGAAAEVSLTAVPEGITAAGLSTDKAKAETLRSKLKRLVSAAGWPRTPVRGCSPCRHLAVVRERAAAGLPMPWPGRPRLG